MQIRANANFFGQMIFKQIQCLANDYSSKCKFDQMTIWAMEFWSNDYSSKCIFDQI